MNNTTFTLPTHLLEKQGHCTIADYLSLPASARIQLVNGVLLPGEIVSIRHQHIVLGLLSQMVDFLHMPPSPWKVITSPVRLALPKHNDCVFLPDLAVIRHPAPLGKGLLFAVPVFAAEVLSAQSAIYDRQQKLALYQSAGCQEYWVIDPHNNCIFSHLFTASGETQQTNYSFNDLIPVHCFPELFCSIPTT